MDEPRVLIIDDEPMICDLLTEDLSELGYLCEVASNGDYALKKMAQETFNIILLDIRLPGISGIDLLKEIKQKHDSAVIMITAVDDVNTAVVSMKLGASDYIVKPFNWDILHSSISSVLGKNVKSDVDSNSNESLDIDSKERELREMDAIADGIEAKLNFKDKRSINITLKTTEIAKELGISEDQIQKWKEKRATKDRNNLQILNKFNQNAIAQAIMGVAKEYRLDSDSHKMDN